VVASQVIDPQVWQAWDVDHESANLLVEARPNWDKEGCLKSLIAYPQMTFEPNQQDLRGDMQEIQAFGYENFEAMMRKTIRCAFQRFSAGEKRAIHLERIQSNIVHGEYRLAPRVFTRHTISEIARKRGEQSLILRYVTEDEKNHAFRSMSNLRENREYKKWTQKLGSHYPTFGAFFDIGETLRALVKMGLNLLAAHCTNTVITQDTFDWAIRLIRGEIDVTPELFKRMGFVAAADTAQIADGAGGHSFRLWHVNGIWGVFSSFFGGKVGSFVYFPGPNHEAWSCADIVAPLKTNQWTFTPKETVQPIGFQIRWRNGAEITPSVKLQRSVSRMRVDVVPRNMK
jgi:hypothetical protein